jgi:hypothetical protein
MKQLSNTNFLHVDVILTFNIYEGQNKNSQEFLKIKIPFSNSENDFITLLNKKLFPKIQKYCVKFNRSPGELIKISTASNWSDFERVTGRKSPTSLGHTCKWHFGLGRTDLDIWEICLMETYRFGLDADMSWINELTQIRNGIQVKETVK